MAPVMAQDAAHMARALELAARGLYTSDPNPRVGCVLAHGGTVVGEGWHQRAGEPHAEVLALRAAQGHARGATAHVTLEPCSHTGRTPPCVDALIEAGVARVSCASPDPNPRVAGAGIERLRAAGIEVVVGALAAEARALNAGFFSRFERSRPLVRLKLAISLDGRSAYADGRKAWISGEAARADVQIWRARSSAVLTGAGTVRADDPRLDVRLNYGPWVRQPLRVVLDPSRSCPPSAKIFRGDGAVVFTAATDDSDRQGRRGRHDDECAGPPAGAGAPRIERVARQAGGGLDLAAVLQRLTVLEVNEVLVECGARLAGAFLQAGLVDVMILYVAPLLLGAAAPPLADLQRLPGCSVPPHFAFDDVGRIGEDLRLILLPTKV